MAANQAVPLAFRGFVLGYVFVRLLEKAVLLSFVKRYRQTLIRGYKGLAAALSDASEHLSSLSEALGELDAEVDTTFTEIAKGEEEGSKS